MLKQGDDKHEIFTDSEIESLAKKGDKTTTSGVNEYTESYRNVVKTPSGEVVFYYVRDCCSDAADDLDAVIRLDKSITVLPLAEKRTTIRNLVGLA